MPVYEINTDQGTYEIDADREPTQAEALAAISNQGAPVEAPASVVNLPDAAPAPSSFDQVISALTAGPRAGLGLAKGLIDAGVKGVQGVGDIYGTAAGQQSLGDLLKSYYGNVAQTAQEIVPRASFDTANAIRMALQDPVATGRGLTAISNPIAAAIEAFANPQAAPSQDQALRDQIANQAFEEQGKQGVLEFAQQQAGLPSLGTANIDVARAAPLLIGAEALPAAVSNLAKTIPEIIKQFARTGATAGSTLNPFGGSIYQASKAAEPFLSGTKLAGAEAGVDTALARDAALQRSLQESLIKERAATQQGLQGVAESRGTAASKGREALAAGRELKTAQGTITPEIVQAETSIEAAAQHPVVILGRNAEQDPAVFGSKTIGAVEGPMKASQAEFQAAYDAVTDSLPKKQPAIESKPLYDASKIEEGKLSDGFEAHNRGEIKRILDESTRITQPESNVSPLIRKIYDAANPQGKADLLKSYPDLAAPTKGTIPKYTWSELQTRFRSLNEGISQAIKFGNTNDARILNNLKNGIVDSMENYASKTGLDSNALFKKANADYAAHQDKFGLNRIQTLFKDDVLQNPENVAANLIHYDNPSQVNALKAIVSPEEFIPVQAQFSQKLFSPTADVAFDPAHFVKQFSSREARATAKAVFGEQGLADLTQIYDASKSFAKIGDLQKTLDNLASQSESATAAFSKAKGAATEAQQLLAQKNALKAQLKPLQEADVKSKLASVNNEVNAAIKELDRVKNYRDLKDWATRISGLNILEAATTSPAWEQLARYSALHLDKYQEPAP